MEHGSYDEPFSNDWIFFRGDSAEEIIKAFKIPTDEPFYIDNHSAIFPFVAEMILFTSDVMVMAVPFESSIPCKLLS